MIWRHLFEEQIASPEFIGQQLEFERAIFFKMQECEQQEVIKSHGYSRCAEQMERRIDRFSILLQYLVRDRQKMLQKQLQVCKEGPILPCVNSKSRTFVDKYFKQDLRFLSLAREQLLK